MVDNIAGWLLIGVVVLPFYMMANKRLFNKLMEWKFAETGQYAHLNLQPPFLVILVFPVIFPLIMIIKGIKYLTRLA